MKIFLSAKKYFHFTSLLLLSFLFFAGALQAQPNGEQLFKSNCSTCHSTGENRLTGPGLKDVWKRRTIDWIIPWVHNSAAVIKSGDAYAVQLFKDNNGTAMTPFPQLKEDEIKAIIEYVKAENAKQPVAVNKGPGEEEPQPEFPWMWVLTASVLAILVFSLNGVKKKLEHAVLIKEGKPVPEPVSNKVATKRWIRGNKKLVAVLLVVFLCWSSWKGWYALAAIGVSQDYQPDQPIKFSHKIHAGDNGINCKYCHSSAEKSRTAGIPSANVCMNCHKAIQKGKQTGDTEIKKIYAALDYDPGTQKYGTNQHPIEWVQIHRLPDLAYFNHSQHVKVAGLECQKCHGTVETMETVKQFAPLTMGWCINCHRETEVKMDGNGYYTKLHEDLKKKYGADAKLTVDKIGGIECARCHY